MKNVKQKNKGAASLVMVAALGFLITGGAAARQNSHDVVKQTPLSLQREAKSHESITTPSGVDLDTLNLTVQFDGASLSAVLNVLKYSFQMELTSEQGVSGEVSMGEQTLTGRQLLNEIARQTKSAWRQDGSRIIFSKKTD